MSMSKKDYIAVADILHELVFHVEHTDYTSGAVEMLETTIHEIGKVFKENNPKFNEKMFIDWIFRSEGK